MKGNIKLLGLIVAAVMLAITGPTLAEDRPVSPLGKLMHKLADGLKFVQTNLGNPDLKAPSLEQIKMIKHAAVDCRNEIPATTNGESEKIAEYKSLIDELIKQIDALEAAVSQDEIDQAKQTLKRIDNIRKSGHAKFKPPTN